MLFFGIFWRESARIAAECRTNLCTANGPIGPEVAQPSVFHGHHFYLNVASSNYCWIVSGDISNCSSWTVRHSLSRVRISVRPSKVCFRWKPPKNGYLSGVINDQDRLINCKRAQQLRFVFHWYDIRRQFLRSEFDYHGGWRFYFILHIIVYD